jgi:hypothetical protein
MAIAVYILYEPTSGVIRLVQTCHENGTAINCMSQDLCSIESPVGFIDQISYNVVKGKLVRLPEYPPEILLKISVMVASIPASSSAEMPTERLQARKEIES